MAIDTDFLIDNTNKRIYYDVVGGSGTVYTVRNLYTYLQDTFDEPGLMDDLLPMSAQTPTEYTLINGWFIDDISINYLKNGALQTNGWATNNAIRIVPYSQSVQFVTADISRTIVGTNCNGKILFFDTARALIWVRPTAVTDTFPNTNAYTVTDSSAAGTVNGTSLNGENMWSNIFTLGSLVDGTTLDVYQNDVQLTPAWWSSGHIDILVKVKEAGTEIDFGYLTILARKYTTLYDHFIIDASTGRNPVPLAAFDDTNNDTSEGGFGVVPYTNITFSFGAKSRDLENGDGFRPYDVEIDCATATIAQVYEYLKYVTRTGSSTTLNGVNGEYYTGVGDIRFDYSGASGSFVETSAITDTTTGATGYIVSWIDSGSNTGTLVVRNVHGTFSNTNAISSGGVTATISSVPSVIDKSKQAPFGTFAGGSFYGARGVYIFNMAVADVKKYQLTDSTGTSRLPPNVVALTINIKDLVSGDNIEGARVLVWATDASNKFYNASVTITGSGTTATVTHTGHGLATGDYVIISGVTNDDDYNGVFQITYISSSSYSYTADDSLSSPAEGTIVAKWAIISGTTNSSGNIYDTRSFGSAQPITGWIRKTDGSPYYYQQGAISGTISVASGFSTTIQLMRDQ